MKLELLKYEKELVKVYTAKEAVKRCEIFHKLMDKNPFCYLCDKNKVADTLGFYDDDENNLVEWNCFLVCKEHDQVLQKTMKRR